MSWILGAFGDLSPDLEQRVSSLVSNPLYHYRSGDFLVFAGGLAETLQFDPGDASGR